MTGENTPKSLQRQNGNCKSGIGYVSPSNARMKPAIQSGFTRMTCQGNCTNATAGLSAGAKPGCNACTLAGTFTPITAITTNAPNSGPISTPTCRDCQRQRQRLPSRKGKRRSIWNTSIQTTCSSMKPPTGSCNSSGRNYASRKKIIRHWKPKSVLR